MKKNQLAAAMVAVSGLLCVQSSAQTYPSLGLIYQKTDSVTFSAPNTYMELPPAVVKGGWYQYYCASANTRVWASPVSIADSTVSNISFPHTTGLTDGVLVASSLNENAAYTTSANRFKPPFTFSNTVAQWRRNYHGVYSAFIKNSYPSLGDIIVSVNHGENKNEKITSGSNTYYYQNTINGYLIDHGNPATYSGYTGSSYSDSWPGYFAFVTMNWVPNTGAANWGSQLFNDIGPVAWPSQGYVTNCGLKASNGLRHPSAIIHNDSIYIYYVEGYDAIPDAPAQEAGRQWGVKVVRAHTNEMLDPSKYKVYYNGSWNNSLPSGFTAATMQNYVATKGPQSTRLLGLYDSQEAVLRFSVAKIAGTNYFLGIEWYIDWWDLGKYKTALRVSRDLVNWSPRQITLFSTTGIGTKFAYPAPLNLAGDSQSEINLSEFYIIGVPVVTNGLKVSRTRLKMSLTGSGSLMAAAEALPEVSPIVFAKGQAIHINNASGSTVQVSDLLGRMIYQGSCSSAQLTVPVKTGGVYLVKYAKGKEQANTVKVWVE